MPGGESARTDADGANDSLADALLALAEQGRSASHTLEHGCGEDRAAYLEVRRALLASTETWKRVLLTFLREAMTDPRDPRSSSNTNAAR